MADGIVFLRSYYDAAKCLDREERLQLYDTIFGYGFDGELADLPAIPQAMFALIRPNLDASQNRYQAAKENGKKGGAPKGNQNAKKQAKNNQTDKQKNNQESESEIETEKEKDSDTESEKEKESARPTLDEVKHYALENGMKSDPERFYSYNEARGWKIGSEAVTDWKSLFRTWESREKPKKSCTRMADYRPPPAAAPEELRARLALI